MTDHVKLPRRIAAADRIEELEAINDLLEEELEAEVAELERRWLEELPHE